MGNFYGTNMTSILSAPPSDGTKLDASQVNGTVRCFIETVTLTAAINTDALNANIYIARLPANSRFLKTEVVSTVGLGSSQLNVTDGTTIFAPAKAYGATADATVVYADGDYVGDELTAQTDLYTDVAGAALPAAGEVKFVTYYVDLN